MAVKTYKRIFTQGFAETVDAAAGVTTQIQQSIIVAEEDLVIIGYQVSCKNVVGGFIANDGESDVDWHLTTSGLSVGPGIVMFINAFVAWNTTPAAIICTHPDVFLIFPEDFGVSLVEAEVLLLKGTAHNNSAATVRHTIDGTVYYVKGKGVT